MTRARFSTKIYALIVAFAVVLSSLAPTLSHATRGAKGVNHNLMAVCTTVGLKWLDIKTGQVQDSSPASGNSDSSTNCSACLTHLAGLPPAPNATNFSIFTDGTRLLLLATSPVLSRLTTNQANPRAPPSLV
jgi:hypothetical protein